MKLYISDTHFGHVNIMRLSKRPFSSVQEMDKVMIENWNKVVKPNDEVYFLGDFCYKSGESPEYYLEQLNGKKYFIIGNHDNPIIKNRRVYNRYFETIEQMMTVQDGNDSIVLCHYPLVEWNGFFRNALHFYGHVHNNVQNETYKILAKIPNAYNVGVDILDFTPQSKEKVIQYNKQFLKQNGF